MHIPRNLVTPAAVVLSLHGLSSSARSQQSSSGWDTTSDNEKTFVVAYPDGISAAWNVGEFNTGVDDTSFMVAIVNHISQRVRIAPNRIFITGTSLGGGFSHKMACTRAQYFAGAAPVVFHLHSSPQDYTCAPSAPISVIEYAGLDDTLVKYEGGYSTIMGKSFTHLSANESFKKWASVNGCTGNPVTVWSSGVQNYKQYQNCNGGVIVGLASLSCSHGYCTDTAFGRPSDDAWKIFKTRTRAGRKADACQ